MTASNNISYIAAFIAGFLSYLSPCLLPLIPSFVVYITGASFSDLKDAGAKSGIRRKTVIHSLLFISGFSAIFISLGLTATAIGRILFKYQSAMRIIGGLIIMIFGLHLIGILKLNLLERERRFRFLTKGASYFGSFLVGVTFAAAWSPCAGPILGSILVIAGAKSSVAEGAGLLAVYSLGIAVPFFLTAIAANTFLEYFNRLKRLISAVNIIAGLFLIIIGILFMTGYFSVIGERVFASFSR